MNTLTATLATAVAQAPLDGTRLLPGSQVFDGSIPEMSWRALDFLNA